jgi:adenylate cyclase
LKPRRVNFSFRITLLTILITLVAMTVFVVSVISYRLARFTANDLARQLLEQTMARVDSQIDGLLGQATRLNAAMTARMKAGLVRPDDFPGFVQNALDAMDITTELSGFFVGLESTGESVGISHLSGKPSVWQSKRRPDGNYEYREYWPNDYPIKPFAYDPRNTTTDIRGRPFFLDAVRARRSVWTDVFWFLGIGSNKDALGLTYATPIYGAHDNLVAVIDSDFEVHQLCQFLGTLNLGHDGVAYVIGRQSDGSRKVIAHPDARLLLSPQAERDRNTRELLSPEAFPDPRVAALAQHWNASEDSDADRISLIRFLVNGEYHLGAVQKLDSAGSPPWYICTILPEAEVMGQVERSIRTTIWIVVGVLGGALLISLYVSSQVSRPLERLADEAKAIKKLQFLATPVAHSIVREVDNLAVSIEDMKSGLRSFRKYVPTELFRTFLASGREAEFGGERRTVTIFFSDIVNFTTIAEDQKPEQLVELLREYLNTVCKEIEATDGTVDKYIGDAVMAFWDTPTTGANHASAACVTALRSQAALDVLNTRWESEGKRPFRTRIGLHTGEVVVGNIGSDTRFNYTIIGDAVNLSNRLEGLNKVYGTDIIISESTYKQASGDIVARPLDYVAVKGRRLPVLIYELLGLSAQENATHLAIVDLSAAGLDCYRNRDWTGAIRHFEVLLRHRLDDVTARLLIERCLTFQNLPPDADWDGVSRLQHK